MFKKTATAIALIALVGSVGVAAPASATDYTITATASASKVKVKKKLTIYGTVLPAKGRVVTSRKAVVQQYRSGRWRTLTKTQIWADGTYRATVRFKKKGVAKLRVKKLRTSESPPVVTPKFKVRVVSKGTRIPAGPGPTVTSPTPVPQVTTPPPPPPPAQAWVPLIDDDIVEEGGGGDINDAAGQYTNGVFTARTLQAYISRYSSLGTTQYVDWALNRRCSTLTAHVGLDDDTDSGSNMRVQVLLDGNLAFTQDMVIGQSVDLNLPVANALRVRFQVIKLADPASTQYVNFGDAQVYCLTA